MPHDFIKGRWPALLLLAAVACSAPEQSGHDAEPKRPVQGSAKVGSSRSQDRASEVVQRPMFDWMKAMMQSAIKTQNFAALEKGFVTLEQNPPQGFPSWTRFATQGRIAAQQKQLGAVRESCKNCHDKYRKTYRATIRGWHFPPIEPTP